MILNSEMQTAVRKAVKGLLLSDDEDIRCRALEALAKLIGEDPGVPEGEEPEEGEERVGAGLEEERRKRAALAQPGAVDGEVRHAAEVSAAGVARVAGACPPA